MNKRLFNWLKIVLIKLYMASSGSTVVEHSSQHPKVDRSSPATDAGTGWEKVVNKEEERPIRSPIFL